MSKRLLIIYNPSAGKSRINFLHKTIAKLEEMGNLVTLQVSSSFEDGVETSRVGAAKGLYDVIVAAGGDSTIRSVVTGIHGTDVPLGVIPIGTGNVFAKELGVSRDAEFIANYLTHGSSEAINCGLVNGSVFCLMVGIGFDAYVVEKLGMVSKKLFGKAAYFVPIVRSLIGYKKEKLSAKIDGKDHSAQWIIVTNARYYGGSFVLSPFASIRDYELQAILFTSPNRLALFRQLIALTRGQLAQSNGVEVIPCQEVFVEDNSSSIQIDGDSCDSLPLHISLDNQDLQLMIPAS